MKRRTLLALISTLLFFTLVSVARAESDFIFTQFLETLLILTILIIIDIIVFIYHKIRK